MPWLYTNSKKNPVCITVYINPVLKYNHVYTCDLESGDKEANCVNFRAGLKDVYVWDWRVIYILRPVKKKNKRWAVNMQLSLGWQ